MYDKREIRSLPYLRRLQILYGSTPELGKQKTQSNSGFCCVGGPCFLFINAPMICLYICPSNARIMSYYTRQDEPIKSLIRPFQKCYDYDFAFNVSLHAHHSYLG